MQAATTIWCGGEWAASANLGCFLYLSKDRRSRTVSNMSNLTVALERLRRNMLLAKPLRSRGNFEECSDPVQNRDHPILCEILLIL